MENGELFGIGIDPDAEVTYELENAETDPEAWRKNADVIDEAQVAWLRKNPQYDRYGDVARHEMLQARRAQREAENANSLSSDTGNNQAIP